MSEELTHHGIKGMKWGVRKTTQNDSKNASYTSRQRSNDRTVHGKRAEVRINRKLNAGKTLKEARKEEFHRNNTQALIGVGSVAAYQALKLYGPVAMQLIALKAEANRNAPIDQPPLRTTKPNRKGVHNITSI